MRCLDEKTIVEAWMTHIMAHRTHQQRVPLFPVEVGVRAAKLQHSVDPVRGVHSMEPVVVRGRFDVTTLSITQEVPHDHRIKFHTMVVGAAKIHGRHMVPGFIQL
eukprot:Skav220285  [mRNA]  locus=scaffold915:101207:103352:- [translate_table: standard]